MNPCKNIITLIFLLFTFFNTSAYANAIAGSVQIVKGDVTILVPLAKQATK